MVTLSWAPGKKIQRPKEFFLDALEAYMDTTLVDFGKKDHQCSVLFCEDVFIQNLNSHYRGKDSATDVLSFAQEEGEVLPSEVCCLGDVIVSAETALKQSQEYGVTYEEELARLCTHGLLHLLGYDHERSPDDEKEMLALQDHLLDNFMTAFEGIKSSHI